MTKIRHWLGPFWPIAIFSVIALITLSASRAGLGLWQQERVDAVAGWSQLLLQGIRVDLATLLYIEYLIYPKEVLAMLWAGRKGELLLALVFSLLTLGGGWWLSGRLMRHLSFPRWTLRPAFALLILAIGFLGARSSLGHRALNPAMVAFASDPLVNALTVNSAYSLFFAIKQMSNEESAGGTSAPRPCPARPSTQPAIAASRRTL